MDALGVDAVVLGEITAYDPATVRRYLSGKKSMDSRFIEKLLERIPNINEHFLLTGEGEVVVGEVNMGSLLEKYKRYDKSLLTKGVIPDVCDRVRLVRVETGQSQSDFATSIRAARHLVAGIENYRQNPTPAFSAALNKKYGINLNWLFTGIGSKQVGVSEGETANVQELKAKINELTATNRALLKVIEMMEEK